MLCQNCHTNDAGVHLRRIVNGEAAEMHLCADCARALGYGNLFPGFAFPFAGARAEPLAAPDFSTLGNRVLRCDVCGLSFDDIVRASRPGCPNCYRVFYDRLLPSIRKMHGRALNRSAPPVGVDPAPEADEKWYKEKKAHSDVVLGSAVQLRANIDGLPFPARLTPAQKTALAGKIYAALGSLKTGLTLTDPSKLYPYELVAFAERNLITPEFASAREGSLFAYDRSEKRCLMLCDEDHIKLRTVTGGLMPEQACAVALQHRAAVDRVLPLAVSQKLGFLNQSPADLGTGMVCSVIMHLPALSKTGALPALSSIVSKLGLSVSGISGNALSVAGDMFRISNTLTLGLSEEQAMSNLKSFCLQLETKERDAAEQYMKDIAVQDRIRRAASVLSSAMLLTAAEMNELLSWLRMGTVNGLCEFDVAAINELIFTLQPAGVNALAGAKISAPQRDEMRASLVRKALFSA